MDLDLDPDLELGPSKGEEKEEDRRRSLRGVSPDVGAEGGGESIWELACEVISSSESESLESYGWASLMVRCSCLCCFVLLGYEIVLTGSVLAYGC